MSDIAVNPNMNKIYAIGENNKNLSILDGTNDEVVKNETLTFFPLQSKLTGKPTGYILLITIIGVSLQ